MEKVLRYFTSTLNLTSEIVTHLGAGFCLFNVSDKFKGKGKALVMIESN